MMTEVHEINKPGIFYFPGQILTHTKPKNAKGGKEEENNRPSCSKPKHIRPRPEQSKEEIKQKASEVHD